MRVVSRRPSKLRNSDMKSEQLAGMILKVMQESQRLAGVPLVFSQKELRRVFQEEIAKRVGQKMIQPVLIEIVNAIVDRRSEYSNPKVTSGL